MNQHHRFRSATASERGSDSLRPLVRKEIGVDEYVRELERRVRERHRESEGGNAKERSDPPPDPD